ncbi:hypothetical protein BC938DRAFT_475855 [Jimgerdemannia flammicorona]|uniref:Fe2OG dioxygenase domain-containing protein n=1 Tax=Jimgerdemannia flammicorona TaxID=994334 RepID=A0A433PN07_9FUNG|nr:hypothetical protein BC938DRAFT_475855 [Jimgerdemannia flammicorona]
MFGWYKGLHRAKPTATPAAYKMATTIDASSILNPNDTDFAKRVVVHDIDLRTILPDRERKPYVMVLENVCTLEECRKLIELSEQGQYTTALLNEIVRTDVRNSDRYMRDDPEIAELLWKRLKPYVPVNIGSMPVEVVGLNERLRFLRYDPGMKFEGHMDGTYIRPGGRELSRVTVQLYLNEGFEGGETTFLGTYEDYPVVPKTGLVLIFEHALLHEGSAVRAGRKYAIRTDVMYRRRNNGSRLAIFD